MNCNRRNTASNKLQTLAHESDSKCETASFRFESDMVKPLVAHIPSAFRLHPGQRARLLLEQPIGSVIPDLLFGIWSGELPRCGGLNTVSRHILAWLATQKVAHQETLRENLLLSQYATESAVSALKRVGAVSKRDSGEVELRSEFNVSASIRLIAIEMKLKKWREALAQALEYRKFADEAYVVLDGNQAQLNASVRDAFVANGVGLFLQHSEGLEEKISAISTKPEPSVDRLFAVGKLSSSGPYCLA
jgi:hypothetical protein